MKQSSAGLLCRCIYCHGIFKLFSYCSENDATCCEFECDCGRTIKVEEAKTFPDKEFDESIIAPSCFEEVEKR